MNDIINFDFEQQQVDVVEIEGEAWFVASDVSKILGYAQTNSMNKHIDEEDKMKHALQNGGNYVNQSLINESGVYSAVFGSKKPEAKRFKKWVTSEVLPSIRKTGSYQTPLTREQELARSILLATEVMEEQKQTIENQSRKIEEDVPKVEYYQSVGNASGFMTVGEAVKSMNIEGLGRNKAMALLRSIGVLQSSNAYWNQPYQQYINQGYFKMKQKLIPTGQIVPTTLVTPKGHQWLYKKLTQ